MCPETCPGVHGAASLFPWPCQWESLAWQQLGNVGAGWWAKLGGIQTPWWHPKPLFLAHGLQCHLPPQGHLDLAIPMILLAPGSGLSLPGMCPVPSGELNWLQGSGSRVHVECVVPGRGVKTRPPPCPTAAEPGWLVVTSCGQCHPQRVTEEDATLINRVGAGSEMPSSRGSIQQLNPHCEGISD